MLYTFIKVFSNILADKEIPIPCIDLQPHFIVPTNIFSPEDEENSSFVKNFHSLNFSIDYHFDKSTNTLEMIRQNFDFSEDPKIVLKRFVLKNYGGSNENSPQAPKEIVLPDNENPKGLFRKFVSKGPHNVLIDYENLNVVCQMISLYMDYKDIEEELFEKTTPLEQIVKLLEIDEELTHTKFAFQFFVTIKKSGCDKNEDSYITISTEMFRIDFDDDFTRVECIKVNPEDYFTENEQLDLEDSKNAEKLENGELIKIA